MYRLLKVRQEIGARNQEIGNRNQEIGNRKFVPGHSTCFFLKARKYLVSATPE
jgi:hypothetical protein